MCQLSNPSTSKFVNFQIRQPPNLSTSKFVNFQIRLLPNPSPTSEFIIWTPPQAPARHTRLLHGKLGLESALLIALRPGVDLRKGHGQPVWLGVFSGEGHWRRVKSSFGSWKLSRSLPELATFPPQNQREHDQIRRENINCPTAKTGGFKTRTWPASSGT